MTMTSHDATPTLKPCPFCGSTPTMEPWHGGGPGKQIVHCEHYSCLVAPMVTGETPKLAKLKWNTRFPASAPALAEENARLREALANLHSALADLIGQLPNDDSLADYNLDWVESASIQARAALAQKEPEDV